MSASFPPSDIDRRLPRLVTIEFGATLHRFYAGDHEPIFYDRTLGGRLNSPTGTYGVLYTARDARGAFAETFLRTPGRRMIDTGLLARKAYTTLEVIQPLTLVDFDGPGLAIVGATAEVVHGGLPYTCPKAWSAALQAHPLAVHGIAYSARHDPHETCYALFERGSALIREQRRITDLDADWFWRLAEIYSVAKPPG